MLFDRGPDGSTLDSALAMLSLFLNPGSGPGEPTSVSIVPGDVSVSEGSQEQFTAVVRGASQTDVLWSVQEETGGTVSATGIYTAPAAPGSFHVVASLRSNPDARSVATVSVVARVITIVISPDTVTATTGSQVPFQAVVAGTANSGVAWSVTEPGGGSITQGGLYTLPGVAGTFHVRATVRANTAVTAEATVRVVQASAYVTPGDITGDAIVSMDTRQTRSISPFIYGLNAVFPSYGETSNWGPYLPNFAFCRYGGNNTTALNWETGYSNAGFDYSFMNYSHALASVGASVGPGHAIAPRIDVAHSRNAGIVITLPILGYAARDDAGTMPIPVAPNATTPATLAPTHWLAVKPRNPGGATATPDRNDDYVYTDDFVQWVNTQYPGAASASTRTIHFQLDNEPDLWHDTHLEIRGLYQGRAIPTGFHELVEKTVQHAKAVKSVVPNAVVWGGGFSGFDGLMMLHYPGNAPDAGHATPPPGYTYYLDYFLDKLKQESHSANTRLLDVLDIHWYTQSWVITNDYLDQNATHNGSIPPAEREQSPRSLWDPYYVEPNSWVPDAVPAEDAVNCNSYYRCPLYIIPRIQSRIDRYYPGTKLAIGEYWYGRGGDISSTIANADALGIFGKFGVYAATMWPNGNAWAYNEPNNCGNSESCALDHGYRCALMAIDIYRNYDGANSAFGDTYVGTAIQDPAFTNPATQSERITAYASMDAGNPDRLVIVAINKATIPLTAGLKITHTREFQTAEVWQVTGTNGGAGGCGPLARQPDISLPVTNALQAPLPAQSVSVIVLRP